MNASFVIFLIDVAGRLLDLIRKSRANAARANEWTPAERAAVDAAFAAQITSKPFLTDAEGG